MCIHYVNKLNVTSVSDFEILTNYTLVVIPVLHIYCKQIVNIHYHNSYLHNC